MELGRLTIRSGEVCNQKVCNEEVKLRYQEALKAEAQSFSKSSKNKMQRGMKGHEYV